MKTFDTHCHLGGEELLPKASEIAARAFAGGVGGLTLIAADEPSLRALPLLTERLRKENPAFHVLRSSGIHPHESESVSDEIWAEIENQAQTASAIGETGLDYYYDHSDRKAQRDIFSRHISLASELKKPLIIHCRKAADDVLEHLSGNEIKTHPNPGILHCFTETLDVARKLIDLNFFISFSGILTFKNASELREVAAFVPLDRALIETDSPWLAPVPLRGQQNEPLFVNHVLTAFSALRKESSDLVASQLWENSCRVYGVSP